MLFPYNITFIVLTAGFSSCYITVCIYCC